MLQIPKKEVKPGMVLAKSVFREDGELLLASGLLINEEILKTLLELDFPYFWIQEEGSETIVPLEVISDQIRLQSQQAISENAEILKKIADTKHLTLDGLNRLKKDPKIFRNILVTDKVIKSVRDIMDSLVNKEEAMVNLSLISSKAGYLY
jgi:hypothetical protein